jgi:hypothetical protein
MRSRPRILWLVALVLAASALGLVVGQRLGEKRHEDGKFHEFHEMVASLQQALELEPGPPRGASRPRPWSPPEWLAGMVLGGVVLAGGRWAHRRWAQQRSRSSRS